MLVLLLSAPTLSLIKSRVSNLSTETVQVTDHVPQPLSNLLNPWWWLVTGDGVAPEVNNGQPYLPSIRQQWLRNIFWWFRNPCGNFVGYVIGLEGINYSVTGTAPVLATTGRDCDPQQFGWRWAIVHGAYPFVSFWNGTVEFYLGWRPASGGFGLKLVFAGGI